MILGAFASMLSGLMAWFAPTLAWFYPIMILTALANVSFWTIGMAMTMEFGSQEERPIYIGMANTLIAPGTILIPIIGGWLAGAAGYQATFILAAAFGLVTAAVLYWLVQESRQPALETAEEPT